MKGLKMKPDLGKIKSDIWGEVLLNKTKKETYVGHGLGCGLTHGLSVLFHLSRIMFFSTISLSKPLYADVFKLPFCLSVFSANPPPQRKPCQLITGLTVHCVFNRGKECHGCKAIRLEVGTMETAFC